MDAEKMMFPKTFTELLKKFIGKRLIVTINTGNFDLRMVYQGILIGVSKYSIEIREDNGLTSVNILLDEIFSFSDIENNSTLNIPKVKPEVWSNIKFSFNAPKNDMNLWCAEGSIIHIANEYFVWLDEDNAISFIPYNIGNAREIEIKMIQKE